MKATEPHALRTDGAPTPTSTPLKRDFRALPDLASAQLGGSVRYANDEFFAAAANLIVTGPAIHDPGTFDYRGKVYDGWETRRRREAGEDFVIVRLAAPAIVRGVNIDTSFFRGNYPPTAAVHGLALFDHPDVDDLLHGDWTPLIEHTDLDGDSPNVVAVEEPDRLVTHVKLIIRPDGGVARLRVYGDVVADPRILGARVDLAATLHGGRIVDCSNMFYSSPANVLAPGRAAVMSDGWETARRRDDGNDWLTVRLAAAGVLHHAIVDTLRFVGNAPGWTALSDADTGEVLIERTALLADTEHRLAIASNSVVSTVRLDIYPDGGLSRLRILGAVAEPARNAIADRWVDLLGRDVDRGEFFS